VQNVIGGCLAVPAMGGDNTLTSQSPTRPYPMAKTSGERNDPRGIVNEFNPGRSGGGGGGKRPPQSPDRVVYPTISNDTADNYVIDNDASVANSAATGSMLLGEGLVGTAGVSPVSSPPRFIEDQRATSRNISPPLTQRSASPTAAAILECESEETENSIMAESGSGPPRCVEDQAAVAGDADNGPVAAGRNISPPLTHRSTSPITAAILECATEETENSILAGSDDGDAGNADGDNHVAREDAAEGMRSADEEDGDNACNETHEDAFVEVVAADDVLAMRTVLSTSSDANADSNDEGGIEETGLAKVTQITEDHANAMSNANAISNAPDDDEGENENGPPPKTAVEYLRIVSNLRLQLDSLQQTATLAQRGWDDARTTLDKERSEAAKVHGEIEMLKEENASLKRANASLKDANDELQQNLASDDRDDRKWAKLQEENESLKAELFESQQELMKLKQQNAGPSDVARTLSYDEMPTSYASPPVSPRSPSLSRPAGEIPTSPSSPSASIPSVSSKDTKARIRAERKARRSGARPTSRGRASRKTEKEDVVPLPDAPMERQFTLPLLDGEVKAHASSHEVKMRTPRRASSEKEPKALTSPTTPSTAAMTPSPDSRDRQISQQLHGQTGGEPTFGGEAGDQAGAGPSEAIRSAPLHIIQPPRLLPDALSRSPHAHVVMKYIGPRSYASDTDFTESEFDAAYLNLEDANHRARYAFFVLNAMGREVEDLLDDPSVMVGTTDGGERGSSPWGECLKLTYRYKDWDGRKMVWKVWVVPAGGQQPRRERTESNDSLVRKVTSQGPNGPTMKMFV